MFCVLVPMSVCMCCSYIVADVVSHLFIDYPVDGVSAIILFIVLEQSANCNKLILHCMHHDVLQRT